MDSSALVALISRVSDQRPKTFSIVFDENTFTEAPFFRAVAERFNTDHSEIRLSERRLIDLLPDAIAAIDQPTMDGINTFVVSGAVEECRRYCGALRSWRRRVVRGLSELQTRDEA